MADAKIVIDAEMVDHISGTLGRMSNAWTEFNSVMRVAESVGRVIKGTYDATVKSALTYADSVRTLTDVSTMSAEESSRFIQVLDDYQLTAQDALTATKALTRQGHEPSLATLANLSEEYKTLNSAEEQNAFIIKNLGRGGLEWARVLGLGREEIIKLGTAVDKNLILSQKQLDAAEKNRLAMDELSDSWNGFSIALGNASIPKVTGLLGEMNNNIEKSGLTLGILRFGFDDIIRGLSQGTEEIDEWSKMFENSTTIIEDNTEALKANSEANKGMLGLIGTLQGEMDSYNEKWSEAVAKYGEASTEVQKLEQEHSRAMQKIAVELFIAKLSVDGLTDAEFNAALEAEKSAGLIDQATIDMARAWDASATAAANAVQPIKNVGAAARSVSGTYPINFDIRTMGQMPFIPTRGTHAEGGSFMIPPSYGNEGFRLGNGDTASGGEKLKIIPRGESESPAIDYKKMARAIREALQQAGG